MYRDTVTLFNLHDGTWRATVLRNVDLNADRGAMLARYGAECTDRAALHLKYTGSWPDACYTGAVQVLDPKDYAGAPGTITFRSISDGETADFFIEGAWSGGDARDSDYDDGFFSYMNGLYSACYRISSVARYSVIPHFEIMAR